MTTSNEKLQSEVKAILVFPDNVEERERLYSALHYYKRIGRMQVRVARYIIGDLDALINIESIIKKMNNDAEIKLFGLKKKEGE